MDIVDRIVETMNRNRRTNLQNACDAAAVDIMRALDQQGADHLLTRDEIAATIYNHIHGKTSL